MSKGKQIGYERGTICSHKNTDDVLISLFNLRNVLISVFNPRPNWSLCLITEML